MLRIAICDDELEQLKAQHNFLREYFNTNHIAATIREFSAAKNLLIEVEEEGPFDLYLVDIVMPEMTGIEFGKALRKKDPNGLLIYLTTSRDFAIESYEVKAFNYLLKPLDTLHLGEVLDEAMSKFSETISVFTQVRTHGSIVRIPLSSLYYAELSNRAVLYHLNDGSEIRSNSLTGSFKDAVSALLCDKRFCLCGASFVVNLHFITMVDKDGALFEDGTKLTLPKTACSPLRTTWSNYWLEGGNI